MATIQFEEKTILGGEYWSLVGLDFAEDELAQLSLWVQEYKIISGDIGTPLPIINEKLAELRQEAEGQGHHLKYLE